MRKFSSFFQSSAVILHLLSSSSSSSSNKRRYFPIIHTIVTVQGSFISSSSSSYSTHKSYYNTHSTKMFASSSNKSKTKTKSSSGSSSSSSSNGVYRTYPELVVFDLDACLWDQEMFEMPEIPSKKVYGDLGNGKGEGVTGVMSGYHKISLHKGSLLAFQEHYDGKYPGMKMALASSANTPFAEKIGRKALQMLEVIPGVSVWDVLMRDWSGKDVNQIGRQYPLSPNKAETHFPLLKKAIGGSIRYDRMLFFDDCNWGDHCGNVARNCREKDNDAPVATLRTPQGLTVSRWRDGLDVFQKHAKTYKIKK